MISVILTIPTMDSVILTAMDGYAYPSLVGKAIVGRSRIAEKGGSIVGISVLLPKQDNYNLTLGVI